MKATDIPVAGDWTGDGHAKVGIYRPTTGQWFLDANNNGVFDAGDLTYNFVGLAAGDIPVVGDWNGMHKDCVGIFRSGFYWILDLNCNGSFDGTLVGADAAFPFGGIGGDVPVVGKWTGGETRVGVVRKYAPGGVPIGNPFFWVTDGSNANAGTAAADHQPGFTFAFGGLAGDVFVTGDWYRTGVSVAGMYRNGFWVMDAALPRHPQSSHLPGLTFGYGGLAGDVPITGGWNSTASTDPAGAPMSVTLSTQTTPPANSATFTAMWSAPGGDASAITEVQIGFQTPPYAGYDTTLNDCAIQYYPYLNNLRLGDGLVPQSFRHESPIGPANGQPLYNGICEVDAAHTSFTVVGDIATLIVPVTFINSQDTTYSAFTSANTLVNNKDVSNNWVNLGGWSTTKVQLISNSLTVNGGELGGTGNAATLTAKFTDTAGITDMNSVQIVLTPNNTGVFNSLSLSPVNGCHLIFAMPSGPLSLESKLGNGAYSSSPIGTQGQVLSNDICEVDASQFMPTTSSSAPGGPVDTLIVTVPIDFISTTPSQYWAYTSLTSNVGAKNNAWTRFWSWLTTLLSPPPQCGDIFPFSVSPGPLGPLTSANFRVTLLASAKYVDLILQSSNQLRASSPAFRMTNVAGFPVYDYTFEGLAALPLGTYKVTPRLNGKTYCEAAYINNINTALAPNSGAAASCDDVTGAWTDSNGIQWTLSQRGDNSVSGSAHTTAFPVNGGTCPANTYRTVTGTVAPATGVFTNIATSNPDFTSAQCTNGVTWNYVNFSESGTLGGMGTCVSASGTAKSPYYPEGIPFTWARTATLPDGETSAFANQWVTSAGLSTVGLFTGTLTSSAGLSFGGRSVNETDAQPGTDSCWFALSAIKRQGGVGSAGAPWNVEDNNTYFYDSIGWRADAVAFYQEQGSPANGVSCANIIYQQMNISTDSGTVPYGSANVLVLQIDHDSVTSTRGPTCTFPATTPAPPGCATAKTSYSFPQ